ncbi:hypothetical protein CTEN210_02388 [Chaetoceros tenuissimus]|uniref:Plastid lipid-associated protein/fibrillin conserved domain-containing protein n=1 Tax=Chaetoceros tenuissimus TaxID=426638 RepID=A0AAD3CJG5_9STRA|nr:hypothetical protein CTEN210_02388 [Chaetoceros tenuissimus]
MTITIRVGIVLVSSVFSFLVESFPTSTINSFCKRSSLHYASPTRILLSEIKKLKADDDLGGSNMFRKQDIVNRVEELEQSFATRLLDDKLIKPDNDLTRFEPLVGLYNVTHVVQKPERENDNPVGGKWTRKSNKLTSLVRPPRTYQHLLPTNYTGQGKLQVSIKGNTTDESRMATVVAEAVNVISFDSIFFNLIKLHIILRGDAVALNKSERKENERKYNQSLSNFAVKAFFDPPRIVLGKRGRLGNFQLGPPTSVVLDTTYNDAVVRVGKGGSSGTRFIFSRCREGQDSRLAKEFLTFINRKPTRRRRILATIVTIGTSTSWFALNREAKVLSTFVAILTFFSAALVTISTGGVEQDEYDRMTK